MQCRMKSDETANQSRKKITRYVNLFVANKLPPDRRRQHPHIPTSSPQNEHPRQFSFSFFLWSSLEGVGVALVERRETLSIRRVPQNIAHLTPQSTVADAFVVSHTATRSLTLIATWDTVVAWYSRNVTANKSSGARATWFYRLLILIPVKASGMVLVLATL